MFIQGQFVSEEFEATTSFKIIWWLRPIGGFIPTPILASYISSIGSISNRGGTSLNFSSLKPSYFQNFKPQAKPRLVN